MKAVIVTPGTPDSCRVTVLDEPPLRAGEALGGTDTKILEGQYEASPPGDDFLVIGHESLGQMEKVTGGVAGLSPGDWMVRGKSNREKRKHEYRQSC